MECGESKLAWQGEIGHFSYLLAMRTSGRGRSGFVMNGRHLG